jgi:hypothetical protein
VPTRRRSDGPRVPMPPPSSHQPRRRGAPPSPSWHIHGPRFRPNMHRFSRGIGHHPPWHPAAHQMCTQ